jgi:hypothetical protein
MTRKTIRNFSAAAISLAIEFPTAQVANDEPKGGPNAGEAFFATLNTGTSSSNQVVRNARNAGRRLKIQQELTKTLIEATDVSSSRLVPSKDFLSAAPAIDTKYLLGNFHSGAIKVVKALSPKTRRAQFRRAATTIAGIELMHQKRSIQTRQASRQKQNRFRDLECSARRVTSAAFQASDCSAYNVCTTTHAPT